MRVGVAEQREIQQRRPLVYVIPIVALALVIVIAAVWSPIFAFVIAVPLFLIFLAYVGFSRRADQAVPPSSGEPVSGEGGVWGERRG
jgi:FtsH-binding integral membrane protein